MGRSIRLLVVLLLAAAVGPAAGSTTAPTITLAISQGLGADDCPNALVCDPFWAGVVERPVIRGAFLVRPDFTYAPDLVNRVELQTKPMRLVYVIRRRAIWSDGVPVSAADFRFTWRTVMRAPEWVERTGYRDIASVGGSGKRVVVSFKRPYGDWRSLFAYVLPAHALRGVDAATAWTDGIDDPRTGRPIGDGPYLLTQFDRASGMAVLQRNPRWWGQTRPQIATVAVRRVADVRDAAKLIHETVDAYYTKEPPPLSLFFPPGDLFGRLRLQSTAGTAWERLDIGRGPVRQPLASKLWLRQAIAHAIDRKAVANAAFGPLGFHDIQPLNSVLRLSNQPHYTAAWSRWSSRPDKAEAILRAHGCRRGDDGIDICGGTKLTFDVDASAIHGMHGAFETIRTQLARVGIGVELQFVPHGAPYPAPSSLSLLRADDDGNIALALGRWECRPNGFCDRRVDRLLRRSSRILDARTRDRLRRRADALLANDLWTLPLYQLPTVLVYSDRLAGLRDNPAVGPTWNLQSWRLETRPRTGQDRR